jgi:hypothetical protein
MHPTEPPDSQVGGKQSTTPTETTSRTTASSQAVWNKAFDDAVSTVMSLTPEGEETEQAGADESQTPPEPTSVQEGLEPGDETPEGDEGDGDEQTAPATHTWSLEDDEVREAWDTLRRGLWPVEEIRAFLDRDLDGALATAKKLADIQADNTRNFQRAQRQEAEGAKEAEAGEPARPAVDLAALARPIADELGLDDEGAKKLATFADGIAEARTRVLAEEQKQLLQTANTMQYALRSLIDDMTRRALAAEIPQLADEATYAKIQRGVTQLANDSTFEVEGTGLARVENLWREAARRVIKDLPSPKEIQRQQQVSARRRNGNPARPTARKQAPAISDVEHIERVMEAHHAGKDSREIRRDLGERQLRR